MRDEFYKRMHELEPLLRLHFSDLGKSFGFHVDLERSIMHEPMSMYHPSEAMSVSISYKYGYKIKIEFILDLK
jgi:hypothetical protein